MGLFGSLFSGQTPDYPELDGASRAGRKVAEVEQELQELMHKVSQPLEVVPSDHAAYVFIGKPPKKFGLAWIHDGKVSGLNTLVEEHGLKPDEVADVVEELRNAYERNQGVNRYTATVQDVDVVVTPSNRLEQEVHQIIDTILRH